MGTELVTVSPEGKVTLPEVMRKVIGIKPGDDLLAWQSDGDDYIMLKVIRMPEPEPEDTTAKRGKM